MQHITAAILRNISSLLFCTTKLILNIFIHWPLSRTAIHYPTMPSIAAISLFTEDLAASKTFYTTALSSSVVFEDEACCVVKFDNLLLNLLSTTAATDLVGKDGVAKRDSGNRCQFSIWVDDVDAEVEKLRAKGVKFLIEPTTMPWGKRIATFEDPAGHNWEVAQNE